MKNKIIGIILTVLVFAVPIGITIFRHDPSVVVQPDNGEKVVYTNIFTPVTGSGISGPTESVVGQLIRLSVKGDQVRWQCLPPVEDMETFGQFNERCVISFRANGQYTIIAAVLNGKDVTLETTKVVVGGATIAVPTPNTPINNGGAKINTELAAQVRSWCIDSKVDKTQAGKLAGSFNQVSVEITSGKITTTGEIINRTASLNQSLELKGFDGVMAKIQAYLTQQADNGTLSTPDQHAVVWASISSGLTTYASEPSGSKQR